MTDIFLLIISPLAWHQLLLRSWNLIRVYQFGFHEKHSTTHLLLKAANDWVKASECHNKLPLFVPKAFCSVSHCYLLLRLQTLGILCQLLEWFSHHKISMCSCGWPLLWVSLCCLYLRNIIIIYIDDVRCNVKHSSIKIFADDISLYSKVSSYDDCFKIIE